MSEAVADAVRLAVAGMSNIDAWNQAGKPGGEAGIQNIRKHKRLFFARAHADAAAASAELTSPSPALSSPATTAAAASPELDAVVASESRKRARESKPYREILKFNSPSGTHLKGYEIVKKFKEGWFIGRVLKPATDASVKDCKRVANFRIFYEQDEELLNQSLYSNAYARGASSAVGTWMLISSRTENAALMAPRAEPLALMPPAP